MCIHENSSPVSGSAKTEQSHPVMPLLKRGGPGERYSLLDLLSNAQSGRLVYA